MIKNLLEQNINQPDPQNAEVDEQKKESTSETNAAPHYVEVNEAEDLFRASEEKDNAAIFDQNDADEIITRTFNEPADERENFIKSYFNPSVEKDAPPAEEPVDYLEMKPLSAEFSAAATEDAANDEPTISIDDSKNNLDSAVETETQNFTFPSKNNDQDAQTKNDDVIARSSYEPQSFAETARQSGLAYAAAITLFVSVVFMLIIGWFADLLFGSSPWGKVLGVAVGALIGFVQLFRITSQIFKK